MSSIFPLIDSTPIQQTQNELPLYKEIKWNFEKNIPIFVDGEVVIIEGIEAIKTWVYKTLNTERFKYIIYSWNYGNELNSLIGKEYTPSYSTAEGMRFIKEALAVNEYIKDVSILNSEFKEGRIISLTIKINTVYGEGVLNYNDNFIL